MASDEGETVTRKKDREPITLICFIILVIACIAVIGVYVNDHYVQDDSVNAADGDTLTVNYTGSFYNYYDKTNGAMFQTTFEDIDGDKGYTKSNDYSFSSSTLKVTIGSGKALAGFEHALIGASAGDTVRVTIPAGEAYVSANTAVTVSTSAAQTVPAVQTMSATAFSGAYGFTLTGTATVQTGYGWNATATLDSTKNLVTLVSNPTVGQTYTKETDFGNIVTAVSSVSGGNIVFTYNITGYKTTGATLDNGLSEIQMIKANLGGRTVYITGVAPSGDGISAFEYKTGSERDNQTLYFVIEVVSVD